MSEDKLKDLLQQDQNLRDAIRQEETERPQMPALDAARQRVQRFSRQKQAQPLALDCCGLHGRHHGCAPDSAQGDGRGEEDCR